MKRIKTIIEVILMFSLLVIIVLQATLWIYSIIKNEPISQKFSPYFIGVIAAYLIWFGLFTKTLKK